MSSRHSRQAIVHAHYERVAVARFQKPTKLSFRRRPEHEIERDLTGKFSVMAGLGISQVGEATNKG